MLTVLVSCESELLVHGSHAPLHDGRRLAEACDYLRDPRLRARYEEIAKAAHEQLAAGIGLETVMGSGIDALKLVSSLTLFRAARPRNHSPPSRATSNR